jgi:hypothetical protein
MKEKHTCSAIINNKTSKQIISKMINGYSDEICGCNAKYFEGGYWYCGKHSPSKIAERERISYEKWKAKVEARKQ